MAFEAYTIGHYGDRDQPYAYPILDEQGEILEEVWDHGLSLTSRATSFNVYKKNSLQKEYRFDMGQVMKLSVYITDSRFIFVCHDYDHGDHNYTGNSIAVPIMNAVQKSKGRKRSVGKAFVGQIRYEWIYIVGYRQKGRELRLIYEDTEKNFYAIDFCFTRETDAMLLSQDILRRACKYRLAMTDTEEASRAESEQFFSEHAQSGKIQPADNPKKDFSTIRMPYCYLAPGGKAFRPGAPKQESEA